jgi:hypothetical protein
MFPLHGAVAHGATLNGRTMTDSWLQIHALRRSRAASAPGRRDSTPSVPAPVEALASGN